MKVVVDTSVAIDYLRRRDSEKSLYVKLSKHVEIIMSLLAVAELYSGRSVQQEGLAKKNLEEMLTGVEIIIPTIETVKIVGRLRARYDLSLPDAFVAALVLDLNIPLATLDVRDFKQIDGLKMWPQKLR